MELTQLTKIVWRWWWLIVLPPLVVGAYSLFTYSPPAASYGMTLRFTAGQPETPAVERAPGFDPNYYRWLASEYIVGGLKDWVRTGAFAQAVSAELAAQGVALPPEAVAGAIVASDNARSLLLIYLSGSDPAQLQALAAALTRVLQTQNAAVFPQLGGQAAVVTPLDAPRVAANPPSLRSRLDPLLRLALALAAGVVLALAAHYLDPSVRERAELEQIGLAVVAEIPRGKK